MNRLVIGVIVWNNVDDTIACVESLLEQTKKDFTILLVNNASSDRSVKRHLQEYIDVVNSRQLVYWESDTNNGTAGGFNQIISWATEHNYSYVGSLNADATADENWIVSLLDELASSDYSLATGTLLHQGSHTIDTTGDFYTTWGLPGPRLRDQSADKTPSQPGAVFGSTGGGFIAKTSLYQDVGLFDEKFFMYYEDVDLSFRAQLKGHRIIFTPKAIAYHKRGASSDTVPGLAIYNTFKNLPLLFWKNVPLRLFPTILPRFLLAYHLIFFNAIVHGRGWSALKGYVMSLVLFPYGLKQRRKIQRTASVSPEYISSIILHDIPPDQTGLRKFRKFFTGKA